MVGAILMALVALSAAVVGLALLVWWLWRLWGQREEAATVPAIEIKAEPPAEAHEPPGVDVPDEEAQIAAAVVEAEVDAPVEEVDLKVESQEVDVEAPVKDVAVEVPVEEVAVTAEAVEVETRAVEIDPEVTPDDLTRIEGIGPKISGVLQAGGILTYAQLADCDPDGLRQILEASDPRLLRIAKPDTWPEQASFAAAGDWDGLGELKAGLKGGKRV